MRCCTQKRTHTEYKKRWHGVRDQHPLCSVHPAAVWQFQFCRARDVNPAAVSGEAHTILRNPACQRDRTSFDGVMVPPNPLGQCGAAGKSPEVTAALMLGCQQADLLQDQLLLLCPIKSRYKRKKEKKKKTITLWRRASKKVWLTNVVVKQKIQK